VSDNINLWLYGLYEAASGFHSNKRHDFVKCLKLYSVYRIIVLMSNILIVFFTKRNFFTFFSNLNNLCLIYQWFLTETGVLGQELKHAFHSSMASKLKLNLVRKTIKSKFSNHDFSEPRYTLHLRPRNIPLIP